jgi:hypothetical protein
MGGGFGRVQTDGGAQRGRGLLSAPHAEKDDAETGMKRRSARGDGDRLTNQVCGFLVVAALVRQQPQSVQLTRIARRLPRAWSIATLGFPQPVACGTVKGGGEVRAGMHHRVCLGRIGDL